ncbi:MAG: 4-hydroxythreonine-4-phosphate dehydrogenase PdxA [Desulfobacteraceae bacterium]|nr:4-hydroxythreonine-4-phosphate dehydrogenase PdxA [Desulfobacteraceae bacterium]
MKTTLKRPVIGISMGDPAGIGPEIIVKALNNPKIHDKCQPIVIGDAAILKKARNLLSIPLNIMPVDHPINAVNDSKTICILNGSNLPESVTSLPSPTIDTGKAMQNYIITGVNLAQNNQIDALVTCPITKTGLKIAGSKFHGHTELIADQTDTREFAMMLAGKRLKVILVSIHIPLCQVTKTLTIQNITQTIRLTQDSLIHRFGIPSPKLAVAGLNPHAGEESMFGDEEEKIITPAVDLARKQGCHIDGPLPPDTVFCHAMNGKYDAVICMYHDQGLIPFKLVHFKDGVNTTLGLPIIRTSVDHGTAYDIAWQGIADPSSLMEAIYMAAFQAENRDNSRAGK